MGDIWRMGSHMESVINAYKILTKIPSVVGGRLNIKGNRITSKWSIRNIDKGKNTQYMLDYVLDDKLNVITESEFGTDVSNELMTAVSPKENFKAVIREGKDEKEGKKKFFLEIWSKRSLTHSIDLTALDIHGDVYCDSEFGGLDWSPDEKKIVYVAEKKPTKSEPFIKRKPADDKSNPDKKIVPGMEHLYREDWGEQLTSKIQGVIVVCDVDTESFSLLDNLPDRWCPGQVRFTPDGKSVVGVAWEAGLRRLGLIFCTNRRGYIFILTLDGVINKLSAESYSVRSPRVSPSHVVWLQRYAEGPHHACHQLVGLTHEQVNIIQTTEEVVKPSVIIDLVDTEKEITNEVFYGIYCQSLPSKCFNDKRLVFSTPQRDEIRSYVVEIETGKIVDISNNKKVPGSTTVLSVQSDVILASCSNLKTPSQLFVARLPPAGLEGGIEWVCVSAPSPVPSSIANGKIQYMKLDHNNGDAVSVFTATYFGPDEQGVYPLVVWPHGGPHAAFSNTYSLEAAFFNLLGFATLQINYRGSAGTGDASVCFLPSRIGTADVADCKFATERTLDMFPVNDKKLLLYGGSHGGFLVAHLSGLYSDMYAVAVMRNPVFDLTSMYHTSDIPDWCAIEAGFPYSQGGPDYEEYLLSLRRVSPITRAQGVAIPVAIMLGTNDKRVPYYQGLEFARKLKANGVMCRCAIEAGFPYSQGGPDYEEYLLSLRRVSPITRAQGVAIPVAIMLGTNDKRVPYYQGLEFARKLKANGVMCRVYMYEDNHSLSSQPVEMDNLINAADWFIFSINYLLI